jgi:sirohydrochlorin ferrochelatase
MTPAVLLIAHGSRRAEANEELLTVAESLRNRGRYPFVQVAYLELASPTIAEGGAECAQAGASEVILLPFFLSPGRHVADDLTAARDELAARFPTVRFSLAEPLGSHPLILQALEERADEAQASP